MDEDVFLDLLVLFLFACVIHTKYVHNCVMFALFSSDYLYCFKFTDCIISQCSVYVQMNKCILIYIERKNRLLF